MNKYAPAIVLIAVQVVSLTYAARRGGKPEQLGTAMYVVNVVLSNLAALWSGRHFLSPEVWLMAVDTGYMLALIGFACRAQRYWPMWAAALQLDAVLTHMMMFSSATPAFSYALALWLFGLPLPIMLGWGAWRHQQRIKRWGDDPAWV